MALAAKKTLVVTCSLPVSSGITSILFNDDVNRLISKIYYTSRAYIRRRLINVRIFLRVSRKKAL